MISQDPGAQAPGPTGAAATEWRYNHKLKTKYLKVVRKPQAASSKRQASSLTMSK